MTTNTHFLSQLAQFFLK